MLGKSRGTRKQKIRGIHFKAWIYEEDLRRLRELCERYDRSASWVIRHALEELEK